MEYTVCVKVEGTVPVTVMARDEDEAKIKANLEVSNMDFGPLVNIDWVAGLVIPEEVKRNIDELANALANNL